MQMQEQKPNYQYKNQENPEQDSSPSSEYCPTSNPQSADLSQILNQESTERHFSKNDLVDILDKAWLLNEALKTSQQRRETLASEIPSEQASPLPLSYLYHRAESLNISREQINKIINIYYSSDEEQFAKLQSIDAKPSFELIKRKYVKELLQSLHETFPMEEFSFHECYDFYRIKKTKKQGRFLFWRWEKIIKHETQLAKLFLNDPIYVTRKDCVYIHILDKDFTIATAKKIKELGEKFNEYIKDTFVQYNYPLGDLK